MGGIGGDGRSSPDDMDIGGEEDEGLPKVTMLRVRMTLWVTGWKTRHAGESKAKPTKMPYYVLAENSARYICTVKQGGRRRGTRICGGRLDKSG